MYPYDRKWLYDEAKRNLVWTLYDYAVSKGLYSGNEYDFDEMIIPELNEHGQAIQHVMSMQVAAFVFRYLPGPWGEVIDDFRGNINRFCNEYREKTGYQINVNDEDD